MTKREKDLTYFGLQFVFSVFPMFCHMLSLYHGTSHSIGLFELLFAFPFLWFLVSTLVILAFTYKTLLAESYGNSKGKFIKSWLSMSVFSMGLFYLIYDIIELM